MPANGINGFSQKKSDDILYFKKLPKGVILEKNVYAKMRDNIKIAMDVYRPEKGKGPWPVILSIAPYRKEMLWETGNLAFYVPKGYVIVNAQVRGSGLSQGKYKLFDEVEQRDGYDIVEWIAQQEWCDGNIGMLGASYLAMNQIYTACQNPPHLKCIAPFSGGTDLYRNFNYIGGLYHSFSMNMWGPDQTKTCIWPGIFPGKEGPENFLFDWFFFADDGPYYWERNTCNKIDSMEVPILSILDAHNFIHSTGQLNSWTDIRAPKKLMIVPETPESFQVFFDINLGLNQQILRWFDHWLRGIDTGIMKEPPIVIYDNGTNKWRYENEYPLARTQWKKFYFRQYPDTPAGNPPCGLISEDPNFQNDSSFDEIGYRGSAPAKISVFHDMEKPSFLLLPVIPDAREIAPVEKPVSDKYWGGPTIKPLDSV